MDKRNGEGAEHHDVGVPRKRELKTVAIGTALTVVSMVASALVGYFVGRVGLDRRITGVEERVKEVEGLDRWLRAGQIKLQANTTRMLERQVRDLANFAKDWKPSKFTYASGPQYKFVSGSDGAPPRPAPVRSFHALVSSQELRTAAKAEVVEKLLRVDQYSHQYNTLVAGLTWSGGQLAPDNLPPEPVFVNNSVPAKVGEQFEREAPGLVKGIMDSAEGVPEDLADIQRRLDERYDRAMKGTQ